jgi:uncharacterized RDD family membrane protein YckC
MQQAHTQEQVEYASVGWRFAAVLVDTAVLFGILILVAMVWVIVLVAQGRVDPNDPAAAQALAQDIGATTDWVANIAFFGALFIYYVLLEGIFGASVGKLVFRMRVVMLDGSRPTGLAIVVRNVIRIPEAWLLYIPAGVSCLVSSRRQRLGDHAARTVVVRRAAPAAARGPARGPAASPPWAAGAPPAPPTYGPPAPPVQGPGPASGGTWPGEPAPQAPATPAAPAAVPAGGEGASPVPDALAPLKTAALAARGAHLTYLHFSERELASGAGDQTGGYSAEYVSAWFTLADAVAAYRSAHAAAARAAAAAGQTLDEACAAQPDLAHLLRGLAPYLDAESDDQIHDAFLAVARSELPAT